jgi:hypothetical protein
MTPAKEAAIILDNIAAQSNYKQCGLYHDDIKTYLSENSIPAELICFLQPMESVTSYYFKGEDTHEPFDACIRFEDKHSAIPADLDDADLEKLAIVGDYLTTNELIARIQDVLWLRCRKIEFAEKAIKAYLCCAEEVLDDQHWDYRINCAERALRLASLHRRKKPELCQSAADLLLQWVSEYTDGQEIVISKAVRLLLEFNYGNPADLYSVVADIAQDSEKLNNYNQAEVFWILAVQCARQSKNNNSANHAQAALAECYASNARSNKLAMLAASWMQKAVEAYKTVPESKKIREKLYAELLEFQKSSLSEMPHIEYSSDRSKDISDIAAMVREMFEGKNTSEVIIGLAFIFSPPNYSKLKKDALKTVQNSPLSQIFGSSTHLDNEGKVIANSNETLDSNGEVRMSEVYRYAALEHQMYTKVYIFPVLETIHLEHYITEDNFLGIVINNPFVVSGQEPLYAKGLYAGFTGDFVIAMSILIPLLENSIRNALESAGVTVSSTNNGIQEVMQLKALLDHAKTKEIFGDDVILDLQGLLLDRTYGNLRNKIMHGLTTVADFQQPIVVYLWWLVLRLCLASHISSNKNVT